MDNFIRSIALLGWLVLLSACDFPATCLEHGTPIATPGGPVPIDELRPGDTVWAWDFARKQRVARQVTAVQMHVVAHVPKLQTADGTNLGVTANHPIYDAARGRFVPAAELGPSAQLLRWQDGRAAAVPLQSYSADSGWPGRVYDIGVEGPEHSYFAGGVLVHNKSATGIIAKSATPLPADLSTGLGSDVPLLATDGQHVAADAVDAAELQGHVALITWPEGAPVAAAEEVTQAVQPWGTQVSALRLVPAQPLEPRWYAIRVLNWPAGWRRPLEWPEETGWAPRNDMTIARFHPAHMPLVKYLKLCDKEDGQTIVFAALSEAVTPAVPPIAVRQNGQDLGCTDLPSKGDTLLVRCPTWPSAAQVEVALLPGSLGAGGLPLGVLNGPAPTSWPIVRTKLTNSEAKCQVFWP